MGDVNVKSASPVPRPGGRRSDSKKNAAEPVAWRRRDLSERRVQGIHLNADFTKANRVPHFANF
jgi:hypothetical protein